MKILFVITRGDSIGGAQIHLRDLAVALAEDDHDVTVVTGRSGVFTAILKSCGIATIECQEMGREINPRQEVRALAHLRTIIREHTPDVVAIHSSKAGILARLASRIERTPCVFTAHGWAFTEGVPCVKRLVFRGMERMSAPLTNRIICVSHFDRSLALRAGIPPARLTVIHNGVRDVPTAPHVHPSHGAPVRLTMVARFDHQKDHQLLIRAFRDIRGANLSLVGDGPLMPAIKTLCNSLGVASRVQFLGYRSDVPAVLAESDIFVLASHWEGFPQSTLEAMRAGIPTVVTDVGGAAEAIVDGTTGFTIPRGDLDALRHRLQLLVDDLALRSRMGSAARRRFESEFRFDRTYRQTLQVYRDVLAERSLRR